MTSASGSAPRPRPTVRQVRGGPGHRRPGGIPFQIFYGAWANTRSARSIANARRIIGYEPQDDSEVVYADEICELMLEPARQTIVQGEARGGKGSR